MLVNKGVLCCIVVGVLSFLQISLKLLHDGDKFGEDWIGSLDNLSLNSERFLNIVGKLLIRRI